MPIKYGELQKQLIEEAQSLLSIALKTLGHAPDDVVPDSELDAYQGEYHATQPQKPTSTKGATGRARVTC